MRNMLTGDNPARAGEDSYGKSEAIMIPPKGTGPLLKQRLEKDFEGPIELESTEGGYTPISGDSGHREPKKDPLTVIIDKINEKYGTHFTEMDKVLVQMENDYAKSYRFC